MIATAICSNTLTQLGLVEAWPRSCTESDEELKSMRFDGAVTRGTKRRPRIFENEAFYFFQRDVMSLVERQEVDQAPFPIHEIDERAVIDRVIAMFGGLPHFSCFLPVGDFVAGIEPHASKINVDAWARRQNYGRGTRWRSLGNFGGRAGDRLLSRMRSTITTAAQSIFALFTGPAGARRDRRIESPDDAVALFERVVRAKDIFRSASRRRRPTCASDITRWPPSSAICAWRRR